MHFWVKIVLVVMLFASGSAVADWRDWTGKFFGRDKNKQQQKHSVSPSGSQVSQGLKQALHKGAVFAVRELGQFNGFYSHPRLRIPLPDNLKKLARILKRLRLKRYVRRFEKRMNRAAEKSVAKAGPIFYRAIRRMTLRDALSILRGPDDAATRYFQRETRAELTRLFRPIVRHAMAETGVTKAYRKMNKYSSRFSTRGKKVKIDLERYIINKAISGLFTLIAEQERAIRRDPAKRTSRLLRRVFGKRK